MKDNFQQIGNFLFRIQEIVNREKTTIGALEKKIGASKGVISRAITNGTDIQSKWILRIVENYPDISPDWLLTGRGSMERVGGVQVEGVSISGSNEISGSTIVGNGCSDRCELVRMLTRQTEAQNAQILKLLEMAGKPLKRD